MMRRTVLGAAVLMMLMICGEAFGAKSAANAQTRAQLDRVLPAVNFTNVTLKDAIDFLRDVSGSNIHVNWRPMTLTWSSGGLPAAFAGAFSMSWSTM